MNRPPRQIWRHVALAVSLACLFFGGIAEAQTAPTQRRIVEPINEVSLTPLRGNVHPLARPEFDRGPAPGDLPLDRMLLVLHRTPEQETTLQKLLQDQQDSSSPSYRKWLTPDEFGRQFGPSDEDIQSVTSWLTAHGFHSLQASRGRTMIEFSGTAALLEATFHTAMHHYVINGREHWANANDPQIPAALSPVVGGIATLHDFRAEPQIHVSSEPIFTVSANTVKPDFTSGSTGKHALTPADLALIYNANPLYAQTPSITGNMFDSIVIPSRTNVAISDPVLFRDVFNLRPGFSPYVIVLNGPDPGNLGGGDEAEAVLDMSWAGALAPNNGIDLVVSSSTTPTDGMELSELYAIENNIGSVMAASFSFCEADVTSADAQAISSLAQQAAAQGITFLVSTGDNGALQCASSTPGDTTVSINVLASNPYTVAVGGTEFNENGNDSLYWNPTNSASTGQSAISYIPEDAWNETQGSGGGGASIYFTKPSWQAGVPGIPSQNARFIPDVSLTAASHDPYLMCLHLSCQPDSQGKISFFAVYGTSASVQAFGGIMALVDQKMGVRQGQADYVLYRLAASENFGQCNASALPALAASGPCIFNDVTIGNNAVSGEIGYGTPSARYQSGVGFDPATGLGSVNVANLVNAWGSIHLLPTTTTLQLNNGNPVHIAHGQSVPVSITVTGGGTPTGEVTLGGGNAVYFQDLVVFPLVNGAVNASTNLLPGGSYLAIAQYGGDANFAPSRSQEFQPVTVDPEASKTSMSIKKLASGHVYSANGTVPAGDYEWLVNVTNAAGTPCTPGLGLPQCPVGGIDLFDGNYKDFVNQSSVAFIQLDLFGNTQTLAHLTVLGQHTLQTTYSGDNNFAASGTTMSVNVDGIEIYPTNSFLNVGQGGSSTITLTVLTADVYGPVNFDSSSCSGLPSLASCSFSPGSITGNGQTVIAVSTKAPTFTQTAARPGNFRRPAEGFWLTMAVALFLFRIGMKRARIAHIAGRLGFACLLVAFAGCGGGGSNSSSTPSSPGTPKGAYTITISASAGGFSAATSFTLNVQ
jgi:hypothetical protein